MKNSRFKYDYRISASSLHKKIGEVLRSSKFIGTNDIYQEYPVNKVNSSYYNPSHHFDWVVPKLKMVIEGHGQQHYIPVAFDGNKEEAETRLRATKSRDSLKKEAALLAGFIYVEIPFFLEKELDEEKLIKLVESAKIDYDKWLELEEKFNENTISFLESVSKRRKEANEKARARRKEQYKRSKERRMEIKFRRAAKSAFQAEGDGEDNS